jgi:ligand-binding SRPBCC domain-containing protein
MSLAFLFRRRWQRLAIFSIVFCVASLSILSSQEESRQDDEPPDLRMKYPLLWEHVHEFNRTGGGTRL